MLFDDLRRYRRLIGKSNYFLGWHFLAYLVSVVSQNMSQATIDHRKTVGKLLCYLKKAPKCGNLYGDNGHEKI